MDRLWEGIVDPFQTNPLSIPPDLVNHCNVYRISVLAPSLTPGGSDVAEVSIVRHWFPPTYKDATLFVTTLLCILSHQRRRWMLTGQRADGSFRPQDIQWLDWCYVEGIRKINRALSDRESAVTDNMILSVLIMAAADGDTVSMSALESPFQAPLRSLQWLDVYGSVSVNSVHLRGLSQLIRTRGGLEMVQLPSLGAILSFFELINCSKTLSRPQFSFISLRGIANPTLGKYFMFDSKALKNRFVELHDIGYSEEYLANISSYADLRQSSAQRHIIQHRLLSLPDASTREVGRIDLAEACRLSTIFFSVGVIFPLSGPKAPFFMLANMLRREPESCGALATSSLLRYTTILTWILILGGIAAQQTPLRAWFVDKLNAISTASTATWLEVKTGLQTMLRLSSACDYAGEALWKDVESLKLARELT